MSVQTLQDWHISEERWSVRTFVGGWIYSLVHLMDSSWRTSHQSFLCVWKPTWPSRNFRFCWCMVGLVHAAFGARREDDYVQDQFSSPLDSEIATGRAQEFYNLIVLLKKDCTPNVRNFQNCHLWFVCFIWSVLGDWIIKFLIRFWTY